MRRKSRTETDTRQRGQTIVLVAIFITVLVMMAALAIDTTTLYAAHNELQKAADAAALAGAEAFVDSGVTSGYNSATTTDRAALQTLATSMAQAFINTTVAQNKVRGITPTVCASPGSCPGSPAPDYTTHPGNPQITVTLQRANLPTFFARIFGQRLATVTASATAEAYNSSNPSPGPAPSMPPVAPACVKPWLVPNKDWGHLAGGVPDSYVNIADGSITHPGVWRGGSGDGIVGEPLGPCSGGVLENLYQHPTCGGGAVTLPLSGAAGLTLLNNLLNAPGYLPAQLASVSGPCSACAGGSTFDQSISCCDKSRQAYNSCSQSFGTNPLIDLLSNDVTDIVNGTACLIGAGGGGVRTGPDDIDFGNYRAGAGPIEITAGAGPHNASFVTTSNQIVTMPIVDSTALLSLLTGPKVVGFMQVFVKSVDSSDGGINGNILNISACPTNPSTPAISGGGVSPVPVRLIHN